MAGRDKGATWRSLGSLCRELDWSRPRLVYELQNGLPFRTVPPGHEHRIDWRDRGLLSRLDLDASEVKIRGPLAPRQSRGVVRYQLRTVGIEVLLPAELQPPAESTLDTLAADRLHGNEWLKAATAALKRERDYPKRVTDAAKTLEPRMATAFEAKKVDRAWGKGHIKNQLIALGLWDRTR
jgi:hypothetical protein